MFNLMPWKKRADSGAIAVHRAESKSAHPEYYPLMQLREEMDAMFHHFFGEAWSSGFGSRLPSLWNGPRGDWNLGWEDKGKEYVFQASLPGFETNDFEVKVTGNTLTVSAEHKDEASDKQGAAGYRYGSYRRTVSLPSGTEADKIDARYHSGVLEIHVPKTEQAVGRRIPVAVN